MSCICSQHEFTIDAVVTILYRIFMIIFGAAFVWKTCFQPTSPLQSLEAPAETASIRSSLEHAKNGSNDTLTYHCPLAAAAHEYFLCRAQSEPIEESFKPTNGRSSSSASVRSMPTEKGTSRSRNSSPVPRSDVQRNSDDLDLEDASVRKRATEPRRDEEVRRCRNWSRERRSIMGRCFK